MHTYFSALDRLHIHYNSDWSGEAIIACNDQRWTVQASDLIAGRVWQGIPPEIAVRATALAVHEYLRAKVAALADDMAIG
jgi:hypothetical protein